jgi:hypothetical protein
LAEEPNKYRVRRFAQSGRCGFWLHARRDSLRLCEAVLRTSAGLARSSYNDSADPGEAVLHQQPAAARWGRRRGTIASRSTTQWRRTARCSTMAPRSDFGVVTDANAERRYFFIDWRAVCLRDGSAEVCQEDDSQTRTERFRRGLHRERCDATASATPEGRGLPEGRSMPRRQEPTI